WAWEPLKDGEAGYPTPQESRFMAYQAVIHGARGLHYYGQLHCTRPNPAAALASEAKDPATRKAEFDRCVKLNRRFSDRHRAFFGEVARASAACVLPEAGAENRVTLVRESVPGGIETSTRQAGDDLYVLAVNAGAREREATFRLPKGCRAREVHM